MSPQTQEYEDFQKSYHIYYGCFQAFFFLPRKRTARYHHENTYTLLKYKLHDTAYSVSRIHYLLVRCVYYSSKSFSSYHKQIGLLWRATSHASYALATSEIPESSKNFWMRLHTRDNTIDFLSASFLWVLIPYGLWIDSNFSEGDRDKYVSPKSW